MTIKETSVAGAYELRLKRISDHRGYFARAWCNEEFRALGLNPAMAQMNIGLSTQRGTLRGMHYQVAPHAEAKLVRCSRGAVYDVVVDLRPKSPTFRKWHAAELTPDNDTLLYAPEGCAHGYQTLADDSEIYYLTTTAYAPSSARGVRYNDPALAVVWPLPVTAISTADNAWPNLLPEAAPSSAAGATLCLQ